MFLAQIDLFVTEKQFDSTMLSMHEHQRKGQQIERFVDLSVDVHALKALSYRIVSQSQKGQSGPETSVTKLFWSELQQNIFNTAIEEQGAFAAYEEDPDYS